MAGNNARSLSYEEATFEKAGMGNVIVLHGPIMAQTREKSNRLCLKGKPWDLGSMCSHIRFIGSMT